MPYQLESGVGILGERDSGQDVRTTNVTAVISLANIVKSSLGPQGLDKMLVDEIGDVTITNDGATILRQLEVEHPAAKIMVELSQLQDKEVGDGTTSVVIIAAELLKRANELIKMKVHPAQIISGFKMAARESVKYMDSNLVKKVEDLGVDVLVNCATTSMSSKIIGSEMKFFGNMVVEAMQSVKVVNSNGDNKYPTKLVNIVRCHGGCTTESTLFKGYILQMMRASQQMRTRVTKAKVACLDINLHKFKMQMGVQVLIEDPANLEKIRQRECDILKERIMQIVKAGANVIITTKGIDDIANKIMVENNVLGLRRVNKGDLRRIAKSIGAEVVTSMAQPEGEEYFNPEWLGECEEVYEESVGDQDFVFISGVKHLKAVSILLRGPNEYMIEEVERSIHDALCVVRRVLESGRVVAGGGACEVALSIHLEDYARTLESKEQIAITEFCEAMLVIPKVLANNAALDATDLIAQLKVLHSASQNSEDEVKKELRFTGLDLLNNKCRNNMKAGICEPANSKIKSIRFATEAAITILRIDDMIKLAPKQEDMQQRR